MRRMSEILPVALLAGVIAAIPLAAIVLKTQEFHLVNCLSYLFAALINLGLYSLIFWVAIPRWLAKRKSRLFYSAAICLIVLTGFLKSGLNFLFNQWEGQVFTISPDVTFSFRLTVSLLLSLLFTAFAVVSRFSLDWHRNRDKMTELERTNDEYSRKLEAQSENLDVKGRVVETQESALSSSQLADNLFIKSEYKIHRIKLSEVVFVEGLKDYLVIRTETEKILSLMSFKDLEPFMTPPAFIRVHKSFVVALSKIDSVERSLINIGGRQIPIGKSYRESFFEILSSFRAGS